MICKDDIIISPSILSSDFSRLSEEVKRCEEGGADALHIDVMDGHFVPNLTLGPQLVSCLRPHTELFFDVHLMVYNPESFLEPFVKAGANRLTFHFEATEDVFDTLDYIKKMNVEAGLSFRPETGVEMILPFLGKCDHLLLMTVPPGFGGQSFHYEVLEKIKIIREHCDRLGLKDKSGKKLFPIQVDGGVDAETAPLCVEAGANDLVAGTYLFKKAPSMKEGIEILKGCGK
jgi:ribulose-phosphate 3-epimerase